MKRKIGKYGWERVYRLLGLRIEIRWAHSCQSCDVPTRKRHLTLMVRPDGRWRWMCPRCTARGGISNDRGSVLANPQDHPHLFGVGDPPWAKHLPPDALNQMRAELAAPGANIGQLLIEWRSTVEVYADPELLAALTAEHTDDYGPIPPPVA